MTDDKTPDRKTSQPPQQSQPPSTLLLSGFGGLDGIDDARDTQIREETTIEKILHLSEVLTVSPPDKLSYLNHDAAGGDGECKSAKAYSKSMLSILTEELKETSLTEQDIKGFVVAKSNCEQQLSKDHQAALGIYSGCLLTLLAERNKREGKETNFHINGHGNQFDYLFAGANGLNEIVVQRFSGESLLNLIYNVKRIIGVGIKGCSSLCYCSGSDKTESQLVGIGIESSNMFIHVNDFNQIIGLGLSGGSSFAGQSIFHDEVNELLAVGVYNDGGEYLENLDAKRTIILGVNMKSLSNHNYGQEGVETFICLKDVPPCIARKVYSIVYGGDGRQYTQHSDYLKPEQLAAQFDGKTHYEITSMVDRLSKLSEVINRRLR